MAIRLKHILCVTDLTEASDLAIRCAHDRASDSHARLTFLHMLPFIQQASVLFPHFQKRRAEELCRRTARATQKLVARVLHLTGRTPQEFSRTYPE
jgi:nucleotide-binding universal stress UspA family protein